MISISEVLNIYKQEQVDDFLKKHTGYNLNERGLTYEKISNNWAFVGNNPSNASVINMLKEPEKGLIERITNGIDAVIEKEKSARNIEVALSADTVIKEAFPYFYENRKNIERGTADRLNACEASDKVIVAINDGSRSNKPTIDVIDQGIGIKSDDFQNTILSINKGNKLSSDKKYLIGAFGQGGSTALPFAYATIIISKINRNEYAFTIIKRVELEQYKNYCYVYMKDSVSEKVLNLIENTTEYDGYINNFINSESGTLVRMIEMEIDREYRANDIAKPGMLGDYINTELFNVSLPIKMVENRADYSQNKHGQNRNSFGTYLKLQTWEYCRKELSGTISIIHKERPYKINYYFILPTEEEKWSSDLECRNVYRQFNVHLDPIVYTVNGQLITTEKFLKLKNIGLSFLQYRLFVEINLDELGTEKYRFFTADRSQIQNSDLTKGFLEKVLQRLKEEEKIIMMNDLIANKSINTAVDNEMIEEISSNVKNIYDKYLKSGNILSTLNSKGNHLNEQEEDIFFDEIKELSITTAKNLFYKNEHVNVVLTTKAKKSINREATIYTFLDDKGFYSHIPSYMNGRIQYSFPGIKPGMHEIFFEYYEDGKRSLESNHYQFVVLDEMQSENDSSSIRNKDLNLKITLVEEREVIIDVSKNLEQRLIEIYICLNHDLLNGVYGKTSSNDEVQVIKNSIIEPLTLFVLFMNEKYEQMESSEDKNQLILSFVKTFVLTIKK